MNTPRRAGVMAGAVLAVATLAMPGCNTEAKKTATGSAVAATQFSRVFGARCNVVMTDPKAKRTTTLDTISAVRGSSESGEPTETCSCIKSPAAMTWNPLQCNFTRAAGNNIGMQVTLTSDVPGEHGIRDAERFTVAGTGDDGKLQKIHFVVKGDDCKVNGVSIDRANCDKVREAVGHAVDVVTAEPRPRNPLGAMNED